MTSYSASQSCRKIPPIHLHSGASRYLVQSFVGEGSFGRVAKCTRETDMKTVAIKMFKKTGAYQIQAAEEITVLFKLRSLDPDQCNIVRWYQAFVDMGYICLEFEHLDQSLYDFMWARNNQPLLLKEIRPIVQQLASALDHLKTVGIIHADIKLANIMLVNHVRKPYRVKVIDFGLACDVSTTRAGLTVQTRTCRAPEIFLGLPFTEAIDIWSLGCVAAGLFLGTLLYPGDSEYEVMRYIVKTQGQPPDFMLNYGLKTIRFFERRYGLATSDWKLKSRKRFQMETGTKTKDTRVVKLKSLDDLIYVRKIDPMKSLDGDAEMTDLWLFVDLIKGMLQLDASKRIAPRQVLEHPFISMSHMIHLYTSSSHVKSCFQLMSVCKTSQTSVGGSLQQFSSRIRQHDRRCPPPPPGYPPPSITPSSSSASLPPPPPSPVTSPARVRGLMRRLVCCLRVLSVECHKNIM